MQRVVLVLAISVVLGWGFFATSAPTPLQESDSTHQPGTNASTPATEPDRSPADLMLLPGETQLITANRTSGTVSLIDLKTRSVLDEQPVGQEPIALAVSQDGKRVYVSNHNSGTVQLVEVTAAKLKPSLRIPVGSQPHGLAFSPDEKFLYVALTAEDCVAIVDLNSRQVVQKLETGRWPRFLALSQDGSRLAVGTAGDRGVTLLDMQARKLITVQRFVGLNIGQMQIASDEKVYFPWIVYRRNPISSSNIRKGWVLASRIARLAIDGESRREAMSLDPAGKAVADPHGLALTPDEKLLTVTGSGTQELLVFRLSDLPLESRGSSDHIPDDVLKDAERFTRIPLGGRPLAIRISSDNRTAYIANYLLNSVQIVDLQEKKLQNAISLGGPQTPSQARKGEALFYDGRRSLDQWYSCHSCHYEGGSNSVVMDTHNDGSVFTFKTVLPLYSVDKTAPWTWHGWQESLDAAMVKSFTSTLMGEKPTAAEVDDLLVYLKQLQPPVRNPLPLTGAETESIAQGKTLFFSEANGCATCHSGAHFTDGQTHDVGLGSRSDRYKGFNTPSLIGVGQKVIFLHDGRAKSLEQVLTGPHSPEKVIGSEPLSEQDLTDLVNWLKSL